MHSFRRVLTGWRCLAAAVLMVLATGCTRAIDPAAIADAQTVVRVKTALVNDPIVGGRTIEVRAVRGVIELSGRVGTQEERDRAITLARAVAGVISVQSSLQVSALASPPPSDQPTSRASPEQPEVQDNPVLFALGGAIGWSTPNAPSLKTRVSLSPLIKLGAGRGLGFALGFDWFQAEVQSISGQPVLTRVAVKPIMLGVGYTLASERASLSGSLVGGYAWNSLSVTNTGAAEGLPVEVGNSLVWRPGLSFWRDLTRRTALNVTLGRVITRLKLTVLENARLERRSVRGDTTIVHAGIAYKLF